MPTMNGVVLPGDSTVRHVTVDIPEPAPARSCCAMKASSICGSDIRAIYREHLGPRRRGVPGSHSRARAVRSGRRRRPRLPPAQPGDRVVVYHIAGCGLCDECRHGYLIGCTSPHRAAYGWQRDGGHAEYLLAEEVTCLPLPEQLSYVDGALVSCGFGTAYEGLLRLNLSGQDRLLVTGLGPVGLAAAMLGRAMGAGLVLATDVAPERLRLAQDLGLVDYAVPADESADAAIAELTGGRGCEASMDCSGNGAARLQALRSTRTWGRCAFVGEGGERHLRGVRAARSTSRSRCMARGSRRYSTWPTCWNTWSAGTCTPNASSPTASRPSTKVTRGLPHR